MLYTAALILGFIKPAYSKLYTASVDTSHSPVAGAWQGLAQIHSSGMYLATGRAINDHPSLDLYASYYGKTWGFKCFKSFDLLDHNTDMNYAVAAVDKQWMIGKSFIFTPHIGFEFGQNRTLADKGSDVVVILNSKVILSRNIVIDYDAIFQNLVFTGDYHWTNRLKVIFEKNNFNGVAFAWYRNRLFNNPGYLSGGASLGYDNLVISPKVILHVSSTVICMFKSDNTSLFPYRNGLMLSVSYSFFK